MAKFITLATVFLALLNNSLAQTLTSSEIQRWEQQAQQVTIIRDKWGIPHVYGKKDADAVFGLLYAQCEDDFKRVELNYIEKLGRMAEIKGEPFLYNDLYIRLIIDSADAKADYAKAPPRFKVLLDAYAAGINYYLYKHPSVQPALLHRFEPWYALLWTDGSIGAISTGDITEKDVQNFYSGETELAVNYKSMEEPVTGSNGFAVAPSKSVSGNALLYINPHVTFYFRPEVQMSSEEGLNVYGAVTWGQFFIYQGFNEHCGWMHTSNKVDVSDMYAEKISKKNGQLFYEYDHAFRRVTVKDITIRYTSNDSLLSKTFKTYSTHHGPVMAKKNGNWITVKGYNRSLNSLIQSWQRTKAVDFETYKAAMQLRANTSNNTVYADGQGNIAYWHGNYVPIRDTNFNWAKPVDGTNPATEWKGLHTLDQVIHLYNPENGWLQNCNSSPFSVAGNFSPKKENYPLYMSPDAENYRGINAVRILSRENNFTLDKLITAGYDRHILAFEKLIPALIKSFDQQPLAVDSVYIEAKSAIEILRNWDLRSDQNSVATTLAIEWGERLLARMTPLNNPNGYAIVHPVQMVDHFLELASPYELLDPFKLVIADLKARFGTWQVAWGTINRFQRISGDIDQVYKDTEPSLPVGFASSTWGMLPSYTSSYYPGTNKRYGVNGNSFICAVEFGKRIRAKSLLAGGESGNPGSPHFNDQGEMYSKGIFKDVLFYKEDVLKNMERSYHPGGAQ